MQKLISNRWAKKQLERTQSLKSRAPGGEAGETGAGEGERAPFRTCVVFQPLRCVLHPCSLFHLTHYRGGNEALMVP